MLIKNEFEVAESIDKVWAFFGDIPAVASCLPGTTLNESLGDDRYAGDVAIRLGPVKMEFGGTAHVTDRNDNAKTMKVDAVGADKKGRGNANLGLDAALTPSPRGTKVGVALDLQLSGAAAQYGRGMISDVTTVLLADFATNLQNRLGALSRGEDPAKVAAAKVSEASGLAIGLRAARMALLRVLRRFFLPYQAPAPR